LNARVEVARRRVWTLAEAREALARLVGEAVEWTALDGYLARYMAQPDLRATVRASTLSALLEMVREGRLAVRQDGPFAPLWVRGAVETAG
jgi:segregation and condensation protein A